MADASDVYNKGDVLNKMGDALLEMHEDKKKMMDPNHKDDDTESEENSSDEENHQANEHTFISAIDVGSHFIDVNPSFGWVKQIEKRQTGCILMQIVIVLG